jgi:hypothetical protein
MSFDHLSAMASSPGLAQLGHQMAPIGTVAVIRCGMMSSWAMPAPLLLDDLATACQPRGLNLAPIQSVAHGLYDLKGYR